jgi:alanyl-tRNA synthetase
MSVKQDEVAEGVANLLKTNELLSFELRTLKKRLAKEMASQVPDFSSHLCRFVEEFDMDFWREVASQIIQKKTGTAIFLMEKEPGVFSYVACSSTANLKQCAQEMNASLCGKGGGKADMIQGTLRASKEEILLFLNNHLTI